MGEDFIKTENQRRINEQNKPYDPITGLGSDTCERKPFYCKGITDGTYMIPEHCFDEPVINKMNNAGSVKKFLHGIGAPYTRENKALAIQEYCKARSKHDFEFWAASFCTIADLLSAQDIKFILNPAQRYFLKRFYTEWYAGRPVSFVITKNRQNGFSTEIEMLFGWIQLVVIGQWNSVICAHIENTTKIIRGMYTKMIKNYPAWMLNSDTQPSLLPYEGSQKTKIIKQTGARISVGSAEKPDAIVGDKISLCHFSEVGLYKTTEGKTPEQLIQSIVSGVQLAAHTCIIYESTARGVGNFFHDLWIRSTNGESGTIPIFIPWFRNYAYQSPIKDYDKFIASLTEEEMTLFEMGATLEGLKWRRGKIKAYKDVWRFKQDFPATADEAFLSTGRRFYPIQDTARLRRGCMKPKFVGDIYAEKNYGADAMKNIKFKAEEGGALKVWFMPDSERYNNRYVTVVDIGGGSEQADRSVICVIDRKDMAKGGLPIVVAEWCGHIDHDLLAWKSVMISEAYQHALLIIESNTLETEQTEGDHFEFILDEIADTYDNLFCRTPADKIREGLPPTWGFHTNKKSKQMVCDHQKKALRENMYIETCSEAVDEHDTLEVKKNGSLGAIDGKHDDRHITRAIGIWACYQYMDLPRKYEPNPTRGRISAKRTGMSSF